MSDSRAREYGAVKFRREERVRDMGGKERERERERESLLCASGLHFLETKAKHISTITRYMIYYKDDKRKKI